MSGTPSTSTDVARGKKFTLSLKPLKRQEIPSDDAILRTAKSLLQESESWTLNRIISGVETYKRPVEQSLKSSPWNEESWHCAVSVYRKEDFSFNRLWKKLGKHRLRNQQKFIHKITALTEVEDISNSQSIWSILYTHASPWSPRIFTVLQVVHLAETPWDARKGITITVPIDPRSQPLGESSLIDIEEVGVRGRYVSVEQLKELEGGQLIELRKVARWDPGGLMPRFCIERRMPKMLVQENQRFTAWLRDDQTRK